jgi:hypothetical protein
MNTFKICYKFDGKTRFSELTAEQIANFVMSETYEIQSLADAIFEENKDFQDEFTYNDKFYIVTFSYDNVYKLNIFERNSKEDTDSEHIVARDVEYVVVSACEDDNCYWILDEEN